MNGKKAKKQIGIWRVPALAYAAVLLSAYVLAFPLRGYTVFKDFKFLFFALLASAFIASEYLLRLEMRLVSAKNRAPAMRINAFEAFAAAYVLFTAVSALLSRFDGTFWGNERCDGVFTIALYALSGIILARRLLPKVWLAAVFGAAVCVFCAIGLLQLYGLNPLGLFPDGYDFYDANVYYSGQFWSTAGNADISAAILALAAGAFAAILIKCGGRRAAAFFAPFALTVFSIAELNVSAAVAALFSGLALMLPVIVCSGAELRRALLCCGTAAAAFALGRLIVIGDHAVSLSTGAVWIALLCAGAVMLAAGIMLRSRLDGMKISGKKLRCILLCIVAAAIVCGLALVYFVPVPGSTALNEAHELLHGNVSDKAGSSRIFIWRQVWQCILEKPFFGGGPDTLAFRGLEGFSRYNEAIGRTVSVGIDAAHSEYLNIWVNQGLFALLAYLGLLTVSAVKWVKKPSSIPCAVGGAAALFYAVQALFGISSCVAAPLFWLALALVNLRCEN